MVAIVSGNSLGLNLTSKGVLGDQGVYGDPTTGQGGEQVYVNASTGNLVMQQLQDQLVGAGLDVSSVLTYNSLGLANDDNGDNFTLGKAPVQLVLSGTVNTNGSTLTRVAFDGSQAVYTWDAANSRYVAVNGTGAFDTISYASSKYTWTDGTTQQTETYGGTTNRILTRADAAGNTITYGYDANTGMLNSVTDANGEVVSYVYSGTLLTQIKAPVTTWVNGVATTSTQPVVSYAYDASNRLQTVTVDLTPDGSTIDGKVYATSFTYDGTSKRVQTVTQSDGTKLSFAYDASNRVYTITDALNNVTTFTYDAVNLKTSVLANGQTTVYAYNAGGQLLSVTAPTVNGVSPVARYAYNGDGELVSVVDADGRATTMAYDAAGNQVSVLDGAGHLTTRVYDAKNRMITETTSLASTPTLVASAGIVASGGNVTKTSTVSDWDSSVRSVNGLTGVATASFTVTPQSGDIMVGLNTDPATNDRMGTIDYALYLVGGTLKVYGNGALIANSIGSYVQGDRLSVSYDGIGHVGFFKNGQVLYTMASTPSQPLYLDTSFYRPGCGLSNLTFANSAPASQPFIIKSGVSVNGGDVIKTNGSSAWDGAVRSAIGITGAANVSFTATAASTHLMVGLNSDPATGSSYQTIDYALYLNGGTLAVWTNGTSVAASIGSYVAGDKLGVSYDGNGHVTFLKNGVALYTLAATPTQPLYADTSFADPVSGIAGLTFSGGMLVDQTLVNTAGMSISGNNVTKSAGTSAWDSSVRSASSLTGAATVSFTATSAQTDVVVGLNSDPDTDANFNSIDYALFLNAGTLQVNSNGTRVANAIGTYSQGDRLSVSYDGQGHVAFIKNGQVLYSMVATPTGPLYVDSSFYEFGSSVSNLSFDASLSNTSSLVNTAVDPV